MNSLDVFLIKNFVEQVKVGIADEDKSILRACGTIESWAWNYMQRPTGMDWIEFSIYSEVVGEELVTEGVLKVDKRRHRGMSEYNLLRLRVSGSWYNKANREQGQ